MIRRNLIILSSMAFVAGCRVDSSSDDFDRMLDRWTENARTNMTVETSASFRDNVVVPFIKRGDKKEPQD